MSGGGSTGISFVDDAVKAVDSFGKNIEKNLQTTTQGVGLMLQGDFNNAGRTLLDISTLGAGGIYANPDDKEKYMGESAVARKRREGTQKAADDAANLVTGEKVTRDAEQERQTSAFVSGMVGNKSRSPGRSQTLLSGGVSGDQMNSLLNILGNR